MRSLIKKSLFASVLLCSSVLLSAQSITNSAYNVFGIGTLEQPGLVSYEGMGYAAIGSRAGDLVNLKNPAALNSIRGFTQIFDVGIALSGLSQEVNDETVTSSFGGLHDLNYWFRASPKTALSLGISKFSDANYDILDSQSGSSAVGRSDSRHLGEGGSSQLYVAGAYSLSPNLHVGLKSNFLFGSLLSDEVVTLFDPRAELEIESKRSFVTANLEAGLQYQFLLSSKTKMVLGSTFRTGGFTSLREDRLIVSDAGTSVDSLRSDGNTSEIYLPRKLGFGVGLESQSWMINLDYEFENWGDNEDQDSFSYQDRFTASMGLQFVNDRFSEKLINRVAFRMGAGVHSNYVEVENQEYLSSYYTFGLGVPLNRGAASVNLSYQHYTNGTLNSSLIRESANTFSISVSIRDFWFRKRAFD